MERSFLFDVVRLRVGTQKIDKLTKPIQKDSIINDTVITNFYTELKELIIEIFNSNVDFIQKQVS